MPRQLPPDVSGFVGRTDALIALAGRAAKAPTTVITGTAGVGKTALAVHWAYQVAEFLAAPMSPPPSTCPQKRPVVPDVPIQDPRWAA